MAFWSDPQMDPKRAFKFLMYIGGVPTYVVKKVTRPEVEIGNVKHQFLNWEFNFPTRAKYSTVSLTITDPISPDMSAEVLGILQRSGFHYPEDPNDVTTISKSKAVGALGNVVIVQLGSDGEEIERTELVNAWVKKVSWGQLDYDSEDLLNIDVELVFDYARITTTGQTVGAL